MQPPSEEPQIVIYFSAVFAEAFVGRKSLRPSRIDDGKVGGCGRVFIEGVDLLRILSEVVFWEITVLKDFYFMRFFFSPDKKHL